MNLKKILLIITAILLVLSAASCSKGKTESELASSAVQVLEAPDPELLGGWIFKNPDNEFELLAFEFGPDSTAVIMNFKDGQQIGEKLSATCKYLIVKGVKAIEITLNSGEKMNYFYQIDGKTAILTDADTGEQMELYQVIDPNN
ncbi:MAG: hypothetical protein LBS74_01330 [Oscillospiraceae bacterium]|jgi:hypothetical protein|nr:hypothetical protein [Oscillospiraceae bacterium]